jgi:hypothetical protein
MLCEVPKGLACCPCSGSQLAVLCLGRALEFARCWCSQRLWLHQFVSTWLFHTVCTCDAALQFLARLRGVVATVAEAVPAENACCQQWVCLWCIVTFRCAL